MTTLFIDTEEMLAQDMAACRADLEARGPAVFAHVWPEAKIVYAYRRENLFDQNDMGPFAVAGKAVYDFADDARRREGRTFGYADPGSDYGLAASPLPLYHDEKGALIVQRLGDDGRLYADRRVAG